MASQKENPSSSGKGYRDTTLMLSDVVWEKRLQHRSDQIGGSFKRTTVEAYAETMTDTLGWGEFPPLTVIELTEPVTLKKEEFNRFSPDDSDWKETTYAVGTLIGIGGWHRSQAAAMTGIDDAPVRLWRGSWADALVLSWKENSNHGQPRTHDEIQTILHQIHIFHPQYRELSAPQVAKIVGTSRATVIRYRAKQRELEEAAKRPQPVTPPSAGSLPFGSTSSSGSSGRSVYRDAWGREVPERLVEKFRAVDRAKTKAAQIRQLGEDLLQLTYGSDTGSNELKEPALERVPIRDIHADLCHLADNVILANLPHLICPECDGEGVIDPDRITKARCEVCLGEGEITRSQSDGLTPAQERLAKAWASEAGIDTEADKRTTTTPAPTEPDADDETASWDMPKETTSEPVETPAEDPAAPKRRRRKAA